LTAGKAALLVLELGEEAAEAAELDVEPVVEAVPEALAVDPELGDEAAEEDGTAPDELVAPLLTEEPPDRQVEDPGRMVTA